MEKLVVAAFDFDGTITYRDTFFLFLIDIAGPFSAALYFLAVLPVLIAYKMGLKSRQQAKEAVLEKFVGGMPIEELEKKGAAFSRRKLGRQVRPEALRRIEWHRKRGDRCVLVSASLDIYLRDWAEEHGFQDLLCSTLEVKEGKATGKLNGLNCRRGEKVRRLRELLGPGESYTLYAYGDSRGDKELLEYADFPYYRQMPESEDE